MKEREELADVLKAKGFDESETVRIQRSSCPSHVILLTFAESRGIQIVSDRRQVSAIRNNRVLYHVPSPLFLVRYTTNEIRRKCNISTNS